MYTDMVQYVLHALVQAVLQADECFSAYKTAFTNACKAYYNTCIHNCLPEDEPLGSKRVEDFKKLKYCFRKCAFLWFILYKYS